jgi:hypothetical protein
VPEVLQKVSGMTKLFVLNGLRKCLIAALVCGIGGLTVLDAGFAASEKLQRLSGPQIRARLAGRELTDEVHWRTVYERDGALRNYALGSKRLGKWSIQGDDLCEEDLLEPDGGCFELALSVTRIVMTPTGWDCLSMAFSRPSPIQGEGRCLPRLSLTSFDIAAGTFL